MKKKLLFIIVAIIMVLSFVACDESATNQNKIDTKKVTETLTGKQGTPTDIEYSLERYNLIRRAYWVNGQREKANALVCEAGRRRRHIRGKRQRHLLLHA